MAPEACYVDAVLKVIGDRWTLGIIHELSAGPRRTLDLFSSFRGLSTRTLTERLRKLERYGLIARESYRESPPRVEYSLTHKGARLLPLIGSLSLTYEVLFGAGSESDAPQCKACSQAAGSSDAEARGDPADRRNRDRSHRESEGAAQNSRRRTHPDITLL